MRTNGLLDKRRSCARDAVSSCWLRAHTQTGRIFNGSPRRAICEGFFEEVEHGGGALQRNLKFPSGRHDENEARSWDDFKMRQPELPPVCFHEF